MKKIIDSPKNFVNDMLRGIYLAHPDKLTYVDDDMHAMVKKDITPGKVGIATGGGSGHLPLFLGYIGNGMLDGCSVGEVFQSSSAQQMLSVTKAVDSGAGVLYIFGNYGGDKLNFELSAEMADMENSIRVTSVIGKDDVATDNPENRRGVAGIFFVYKCAGAAAAEMLDLDEVTRIAQKAADNVRTMGVALTPCTIPRVGHPSFEIGEDEMELGMGIHGEPGVRRGQLTTASEIVTEMMEPILKDMQLSEGTEVAVLVNGLGSTPLEEQYLAYGHIHDILSACGLKVFHVYVGEFATAMEMAGFSISVFKLDDELKRLLAKPAATPFFIQPQL
ncbi:dihydroxyacetone kinase DhaK subunit [Sporobacter termitidis DSM 10068]|uniref:Dihydroxyacetone kinase DhaK subunit n=1 Tax=Sporobacter termitidis DSM 10068 TaxID=1123282 RepID=A0A1M5XXD2_9FIRM|nr:dihydroxyacetone kinase subunit DhaK [Sporobacter termitidis]SHI04208.1 dihydroxyacetone kinase DhaK subunit [Sporobacter termitidis DSM 10068]